MQGFNMGRYIPPSALDANLSANQASGKGHALGSRARKIGQGILTVRFEMPFAVWCTSCPQPTIIAQGVRFNAEKKKVGMYHSTPIWAFLIKHNACGGWLEIRTDPKASEYIVTEGGKRRDYGREEGKDGVLGEILTEEERERRRNDAFAAFEGKVTEKEKGKAECVRVQELLEDRQKNWSDPYALNQRLRKGFRVERKARHRKERHDEAIKDRLGLGIELLDETAGDRQAAKLIEFGIGPEEDMLQTASTRELFTEAQQPGKGIPLARKMQLQQVLKGNTRAALDPFTVRDTSNSTTPRRATTKTPQNQRLQRGGAKASMDVNEQSSAPLRLASVLAAYDSD